MTADCLFCTIARREAPADVIYEDAEIIAFRDIRPKYRVHVLLIPKDHIPSVAAMRGAHDTVVGRLFRVGGDLARAAGIADSGFRLLTNAGPDAGQVVPHLHVHLLGGEPLRGI